MKYLAVLGRLPDLSLAELSAKFSDVHQISLNLAEFLSDATPNINRFGGILKIAIPLEIAPLEYLRSLPDGKITFAISDYSKSSHAKKTVLMATRLKKSLVNSGRSVRIVTSKTPILSSATSLHNGFGSGKLRKVELLRFNDLWFRVISVQDIDAYAKRDQARPARDAKVGMLPPKLAQILINLCGKLPDQTRILDPFCGTGVLLQEALLMGYQAYGTDLNPRMIEYSEKNLTWLTGRYFSDVTGAAEFLAFSRSCAGRRPSLSAKSPVAPGDFDAGREKVKNVNGMGNSAESNFSLSVGDAMKIHWQPPIDAVATECFLGAPMSKIPTEIRLKEEKQRCKTIILGFLKNLAPQIKKDTPVVIAIPAWLREKGHYLPLFAENSLDFFQELGYNRISYGENRLLYFREGQIVAREIIILRKK